MALTAQNLKEILSYIPDSAIIYSYADHGQQSEQVNDISVSDCEEPDYNGDNVIWATVTLENLKSGTIETVDEDDEICGFTVDKITAVLIG